MIQKVQNRINFLLKIKKKCKSFHNDRLLFQNSLTVLNTLWIIILLLFFGQPQIFHNKKMSILKKKKTIKNDNSHKLKL